MEMIAVSTTLVLILSVAVSLFFAVATVRVVCFLVSRGPSVHELDTTYAGDAKSWR